MFPVEQAPNPLTPRASNAARLSPLVHPTLLKRFQLPNYDILRFCLHNSARYISILYTLPKSSYSLNSYNWKGQAKIKLAIAVDKVSRMFRYQFIPGLMPIEFVVVNFLPPHSVLILIISIFYFFIGKFCILIGPLKRVPLKQNKTHVFSEDGLLQGVHGLCNGYASACRSPSKANGHYWLGVPLPLPRLGWCAGTGGQDRLLQVRWTTHREIHKRPYAWYSNKNNLCGRTNLLLAECEVRTASYGPSFINENKEGKNENP